MNSFHDHSNIFFSLPNKLQLYCSDYWEKQVLSNAWNYFVQGCMLTLEWFFIYVWYFFCLFGHLQCSSSCHYHKKEQMGGSNFSKQRPNFPHEWVWHRVGVLYFPDPPLPATPCYVDTIHHSIRAEYMFYHAFIDSIMKTHGKYCHFLHHDVK